MPHQQPNGSHTDPAVRQEVERLLQRTSSFQNLDHPTRQALAESMTKIAEYLAAEPRLPHHAPFAAPLAPNLQERLAPRRDQASPAPTQQPAGTPAGSTSAPSPAPAGVTGRVGEVARATLNAIDFPTFVASLIQGTFQAIVDSSIQQMEAYAELLKNVATTVDRFMDDNITDGAARDYLADQHPGLLVRDTSAGQPKLRLAQNRKANAELPGFFKDLGFNAAEEIDDESIEQTIVPAARRQLAERRQQTLATMVLMGINRVVVDDGEITAKLMFHIDAAETTNLRFDQTKTTTGNMSGRAGTSPFTAQAVMVNTTSLNAQSEINVRADLTGQVRVKFRSETFPLARFADSAAIQLINSNAKVPQPVQPPAAAGPTPPVAAPLPPTAPFPASAAAPSTTPLPSSAPAAQSLAAPPGEDDDLWAPED